MKNFFSLFVFSVVMLFASCGLGNLQQGSEADSLVMEEADTIQAKPIVVERVPAQPDMVAFGRVQYGQVKSVTTDDILAENPMMEFNEKGEMIMTKPMEVVIRDKQGRPVVHNGGKMEKDSTGFVFRHTYNYIGESMQVGSIYAENTTNMKTLINLKRFTYTDDNISPCAMSEFQQTALQPSANYSTYSYITIDDHGNWTEREVKNYYFAHPDFLSPELINQLRNDDATQQAEALLIEHLEEANATTYTETRTIEYYTAE